MTTKHAATVLPYLKRFSGPHLLQIAMPMGGIGAGCVCLSGNGAIVDYSIRNKPATTALQDGHGENDAAFGLLHIKGPVPITRLIEGPIPPEKLYDQGLQGQGHRHGGYEGLPRFDQCLFENAFPFGTVRLRDDTLPLCASITGWSPLIPGDDIASGMPCAFLEYTFENLSADRVEFEFSYHLSHLAANSYRTVSRNAVIIPTAGLTGGGISFTNDVDQQDEGFGNAAVYAIGWSPRIKAMWFRGGWFDAISVLWREVSMGAFKENDGSEAGSKDFRNGGSLLIAGALEPGESATYPLVVAWHFPNSYQRVGEASNDCGPGCNCSPEPDGPAWRPFYAGQWPDARAVALDAAGQYRPLRNRTLSFRDALYTSSIPIDALDAVASNLAILKSPTILRQENGNVWGWEGCFATEGCCPGSCTHVWNYAQTLPHLFPRLERTLREQELVRSQDERGHVQFRAALPDGPALHGYHAASDGQLGGFLKLYRDWQISGDIDWLRNLYPAAKRSLEYCIKTWDPDRKGGLFEPHHNTYDIEFWGPDGMCGSVYLGALSALSEIAHALGHHDDARTYGDLAERAAEFLSASLFNGEYFQQNVQWKGLRDISFAALIAPVDETSPEAMRLLKAEGPKYQYGTGCLSDGVIGAWMAKIYGVVTPLENAQVRSALQAIYRYNFKPDLARHASTQRPGYAVGHEPGLILCTWPRGGKPSLPFVYSDEVWTGIEYQVASHLIEEGFVEEGLTIVSGVRSRYEGHIRNPFNEYECGSYYARAMASYALLNSLAGFRYSAVSKTLWFGPKLGGDYRTFFATASGFGVITLSGTTIAIDLIEGELEIEQIVFTRNETHSISWPVTIKAGQNAICSVENLI